MDFAFLNSGTSVSITFVENCGRCEGVRTTTCLITVDGGKQGNAPCEVHSSEQPCFCVS